MAIETKNLKAGDVLYDCHRVKAGNTTCLVDGVWKCVVREVAEDGSWALISWNGNRPRKHYRNVPYRRSPKEWSLMTLGRGRRCYLCGAQESDGHTADCQHPRAKRGRPPVRLRQAPFAEEKT